ncbi:Extracellular metalloprotease [Mycena kentingensis (nom. inval.)]|nr:Extracellular metalloprotease [Mycena kentingensis (nom. inval.)]
MIALNVLLLALSAASALGHLLPRTNPRGCATYISPEKKSVMEADFASRRTALPAKKAAAVTIPTYFHVVRSGTTVAGGNIPDSQITAQMAALNAAYTNTTFTFELAGTTRTTNTNWFQRASPYSDGISYQTAMKEALRQGDAATLNLYSVGFSRGTAAGGLLGYATFPSDYDSAPEDDGVVFLYSTVPGGTTTDFNLGGTVQHEVGHWVGLFHTFNEGAVENTCGASSDLVDDTPHPAHPYLRLPVLRRHLPQPPRQRPHPQLHGLLHRRLLQQLHSGPGEAPHRPDGRVPWSVIYSFVVV